MATAYQKSGSTVTLINASDVVSENVITKVGSNVGFNATAGTKNILVNTGSAVGWRSMRTNAFTASDFANLAFNTKLGNTSLTNATQTTYSAKTGIINMTKYAVTTGGTSMIVSGRLTAALTQGYYYFRCKRKWTTVGDSRFQVYGSTPDGTPQQTATLNLMSTGEGLLSTIVYIPASPEANFYNFRVFNTTPTAGDYVGDFMIVRLGTTIPNYMDARWCDKHIPDKLNSYERIPLIRLVRGKHVPGSTTNQTITVSPGQLSTGPFIGFISNVYMVTSYHENDRQLKISNVSVTLNDSSITYTKNAGNGWGNNYVYTTFIQHRIETYHNRFTKADVFPFSNLRSVSNTGRDSSAGNSNVTRSVSFSLGANERVISVGGYVGGDDGSYENDRWYLINNFAVSTTSASITYKAPTGTWGNSYPQRWCVWVVIATINTSVVSNITIEKTSQTAGHSNTANNFSLSTSVSNPVSVSPTSNVQSIVSGVIAMSSDDDGTYENSRLKVVDSLTVNSNNQMTANFWEPAGVSNGSRSFCGGVAVRYTYNVSNVMPVYSL